MYRHLTRVSLIPALLVTACGNHQSVSDTSKIIGSNDLVKVTTNGDNLPENLRPLIGAVGMLELGCTVTHIGNGLLVTAGHCIDASVKRGPDAPCWDKMTVRWNFRAGLENNEISHCVRVLGAEFNKQFDYAVLIVDNPPPEKVDVDFSVRPNNDTKITLFGYPMKRPLEWSQFCVVRPTTDQRSSSPNSHYTGKDRFLHQCDTEAGNSGSAIIDSTTLKIVGVHNGGQEPWNVGTFVVDTPLAELLKQTISSRGAQ